MSDVRLITLDPAHFHAALVQKEMYPGLDPLGEALPLRKFLRRLLAERPALQIRILLWDWPLFFSLDREPLPQLQFGVAQTRRLDLVLDANHPPAACHHEKLVVIDGRLAFCGGIDLSAGR